MLKKSGNIILNKLYQNPVW